MIFLLILRSIIVIILIGKERNTFFVIRISHIFREGNARADKLANLDYYTSKMFLYKFYWYNNLVYS